MPSWLRNLGSWTASSIPTLLSLAALAGLALWGARHDWKWSGLADLGTKAETAPEEKRLPAVKVVPEPASESVPAGERPVRIEFPSAAAVRQAGIEVERAKTRAMAQYVTAYGMLDYEPSYYAELATRAPGTVGRVYKEIGDHVRKGEALALIEAAEVGRAKADFLQSLTQVRTRQEVVRRLQAAEGSVPGGTLREAEANLREARIRLFNDQQRLLNFGLTIRLHEVEKLTEEDLVRHLRLLGLPAAVRAELDAETVTANLLPLTAPFDCQVITRRVAPGEVISTSPPQFVVADIRHLHIDLDVHPEDMARVHVGQVVTFQPERNQGPLATARISHISPEVNPKSRNVQVHAEVENPDGRLRPNTFGTGRILVREEPGAVVVPSAAVQSDGARSLVFVRVADTSFQARPVRPGLRDGDLMAVSGVQPGEQVVTTGSHALKSELPQFKDRIVGEED